MAQETGAVKVLVPVAEGSEEIETVTIVDVLRRAEASVVLASAMPSQTVRASRGVVLQADCLLRDCLSQTWDMIALPGGMPGARHLHDSEELLRLLKAQMDSGRWVGAICAAPAVVLGRHGLLKNYRATCHSSFREELCEQALAITDINVEIDRNLITSQAPGTAMEFALKLVQVLFGDVAVQRVAVAMHCRDKI